MQSSQVRIALPDGVDLAMFCGPQDANLRTIEDLFDVAISLHPDCVVASGDALDIPVISSLIADLLEMVEARKVPTQDDVRRIAEVLRNSDYSPDFLREDTLLTYRGRAIRPKTSGQKRYCDAIRNSTVTFAIGPAGTGKTYLAMAMAIAALKRKEIGRIILTRPVVEAGENLGFLPGTLDEKIDPYVRPLYDALYDTLGQESVEKLLEKEVIEIAPLAYMRGRTLNEAFIILDEAQNTTGSQMKMFLTRMGFHSKIVITGDVTQIDLIRKRDSGLLSAQKLLEGIEGIGFAQLTALDVVRHPLVQKIIERYEAAEHAPTDEKNTEI